MRYKSGVTDKYLYFVAVDATDYVTREPGLATWTVVRSRNGAADVTWTTPTITEIDNTTMPGVYALLLDEDMTLDAGAYTQEVCLHITHAGMAPVTRTFELYTDAEGDISDVLSSLTKIYSDSTRIESDTTTLASDLAEGDFSDILSRLTVTNSQLLIVKSDTSDIKSHLTVLAANISDINSDTNVLITVTSDIQSDTNKLVSDATEVDTSDILSMLTVVRDNVSDIQSDTSDIQSKLVALAAVASDIQSDTNNMVPIVSDIQSDTAVLITKMRGVVLATGTIGATGNTTTVLHIPDAVLDSLSDDEINNYNVVVYDVSLDEYHVRTIVDWTNTGDLATVAPALPFTPEASTDLYWVMPPWSNQFDGDLSDVLSRLTVTNSLATKVYSDTTTIQSDTTTLASDLAEGDFSDILSRLTVTNSDAARIESKVVQIYSDTTKIDTQTLDIQSETEVIQSLSVAIEAFVSDTYSDTTAIHTQTTAIASDTTTLASDLAEADFSDIHSRLTLALSDTSDIKSHLTALTGAGGVISDIASGVDAIQAAGAALTAAQDSKLTQIHSDQASQFVVLEQNTSDTESALVKIYSDTTAIEAAGGSLSVAQDSKLTQIHSDTQPVGTLFEIVSDIYSDTTAIEAGGGALTATQASQLARVQSIAIVIEPYTSDTVSMVTVIKSDTSDIISTLVKVYSDTAAIDSNVDKVYSDTTHIVSDTTTLASDLAEGDFSDILSRLTVTNSNLLIVKSDTSDIRSHLIDIHDVVSEIAVDFDTLKDAVVLENDTIGATGNDTTHVHLSGFTYGDDEINNYYLVLQDVSTGESHVRAITDWDGTAKLATVATLPFTPEASVDLYWLLSAQSASLSAGQDSKLTEINSQVVRIHSDTITLASDLAEGDFSDVLSRLTVTNSQLLIVKSDTSDIRSHLVLIHSETTAVQTAQASQFVVLEQNTSDTESALVKVYSDTTAIEAAGGSLTVAQDSKLTQAHSNTVVIETKTAGLTYTVANKVDANIEYVNGTEVTGAGTEGDPWGP
jgi:hypothetical protein